MNEIINLGVDIGGTKVNIGLVNENGSIINSFKIPVEPKYSENELILLISKKIIEFLKKNKLKISDVNSCGIGVPGTVNHKTGFVEFCPNLGWENINAGNIFSQHLGIPVKISQDSRLAAWAEHLCGAGRDYLSFICLTLGTGIGAGIIIDGKIFHGAMNTAGELGHTIYVKNGRLCNCGNKGCFERYTSGLAIIERANELYPAKFKNLPKKSESVFELAYKGDEEILALIHEIVEDLAIGIANAVSLLSPEAVLLSGGLCEHTKLIIDPLNELVFQYGYHSWANKRKLIIKKAELGSDSPMIGAALLYKSE